MNLLLNISIQIKLVINDKKYLTHFMRIHILYIFKTVFG